MRTALVLLLLSASSARAEPLRWHGFAEAAAGASIPIGDDSYTRATGPMFKLSLRGGAELLKRHSVGIAFELQVDAIPVFNTPYTLLPRDSFPSYSRYRFLTGARLPFEINDRVGLYIRFCVGLDYLTGSEQMFPPAPHPGRANLSVTAPTIQPGLGLQIRFARHGIIGIAVDFPIAFYDWGRELWVDLDAVTTIGFRI